MKTCSAPHKTDAGVDICEDPLVVKFEFFIQGYSRMVGLYQNLIKLIFEIGKQLLEIE